MSSIGGANFPGMAAWSFTILKFKNGAINLKLPEFKFRTPNGAINSKVPGAHATRTQNSSSVCSQVIYCFDEFCQLFRKVTKFAKL